MKNWLSDYDLGLIDELTPAQDRELFEIEQYARQEDARIKRWQERLRLTTAGVSDKVNSSSME